MNVVREDVEKLVENELEEAIKLHGLNHSYHESFALALEELNEADEEMRKCHECLHEFWIAVQKNENEKIEKMAESAYTVAVDLCAEVIQYAAMMKKPINGKSRH